MTILLSPHNPEPKLYLGQTAEGRPFTLTGYDFERHKVISGLSGFGKSSLLAWIAVSLLRQGIAFCLIDPAGDLCKLIITLLASSGYYDDPQERGYQKLWYIPFQRAEEDAAIAFNILKTPYSKPHGIAANLLDAMHRVFPTSGTTANLDTVILYACRVLIENGKSLGELNRFLLDAEYRTMLLKKVTDLETLQFMKIKFGEKVSANLIDSTYKRSLLLTYSPVLKNTLGQSDNKLNFRYLMDNNISCLLDLGGLDEYTKRFLGAICLVQIEQAFLSRASLEPDKRLPWHVIVDEFMLFANQSETAFTNILEQVRKYKGTLYLAHQTQSQLSAGMAGSTQNALSIIMRTGNLDSSNLTQQFYRPIEQKPVSLLESLGVALGFIKPKPRSIFSDVPTATDAKYLFETLPRQQAIITNNGISTLIKTPTLPTTDLEKDFLKRIEDRYVEKLFTPLGQLTQEQVKTTFASQHVQNTAGIAKRRAASTIAAHQEPFQSFVGCAGSDDELLTILSQYHYMSLTQICKLLQKQSSSNNIRSKLNKLADEKGFVEKLPLATKTPGKPPIIWTLSIKGMKYLNETKGLAVPIPTGTRKHGFIEHTLEVNNILIPAVILPMQEPTLSIIDVQHERNLKNRPTKVTQGQYLVPDGYAQFLVNAQEVVAVCFELDRNTEEKTVIQNKVKNYCLFASGIYQSVFHCESLTIAFIAIDGGDIRQRQLLHWIEQELQDKQQYADLFLIASATPDDLKPDTLFLDDIFLSPFDKMPHALIEDLK